MIDVYIYKNYLGAVDVGTKLLGALDEG